MMIVHCSECTNKTHCTQSAKHALENCTAVQNNNSAAPGTRCSTEQPLWLPVLCVAVCTRHRTGSHLVIHKHCWQLQWNFAVILITAVKKNLSDDVVIMKKRSKTFPEVKAKKCCGGGGLCWQMIFNVFCDFVVEQN